MKILLQVLIYFYGNSLLFNAVLLHLESMLVYSLQIINTSLTQKYNLLSTTFIEIISQLLELVEDYNTAQLKGIINTRQTLMERRYKSKYDKSCVIQNAKLCLSTRQKGYKAYRIKTPYTNNQQAKTNSIFIVVYRLIKIFYEEG